MQHSLKTEPHQKTKTLELLLKYMFSPKAHMYFLKTKTKYMFSPKAHMFFLKFMIS